MKTLALGLCLAVIATGAFAQAPADNTLTGRRGLGLKQALPVFAEIKERFGFPILTDVHENDQCAIAAEVAHIYGAEKEVA